MLTACTGPMKKTHIMNALRTNLYVTNNLLKRALENGLIENDGRIYNKTFKGNQYITAYKGVMYFLPKDYDTTGQALEAAVNGDKQK